MNGDEPREASVPLTMLRPDTRYTVTLYRDGEDADWKTNPYAYAIEVRQMMSTDTLRVHMVSGGGFAVQCVPGL